MTNADERHFDDYREQTRVKHFLLEQYLPAYYTALSSGFRAFAYIDGFAGRGYYTSRSTGAREPGSPIRTLQLLASKSAFGPRVYTLFVETREHFFEDLQTAIAEFDPRSKGLLAPSVSQGAFSKSVPPWCDTLSARLGSLPPTFMFVDPCGVDDVDFSTIASVLKRPGCEVFVFFNSSALRRIIGADEGKASSPTLIRFFGSQAAVTRLYASLDNLETPEQRDDACLDVYRNELRAATKAEYLLPFRIESEYREDTSHYLVHVTKNALGFKIMKHVMLETLARETGSAGLLQHRQASAAYASLESEFQTAHARNEVLNALSNRARQVREIENWVTRPSDYLCEAQYKRLLVSLEAEGAIGVFKDSACKDPKPASARQRQGRTTLGSDLWLRRR